ncbi:hypothetical protein HRR80_005148 [Exophiala dermatitidis]|uniref:Uncharacterized protein n=1 Tax=Exophiala dermatitidis TaxID=5970 RepID=A0AAN6IUV4_EXODE|nr:hypothetical protein HRR80_005148 [Exophiala dermatitidis]
MWYIEYSFFHKDRGIDVDRGHQRLRTTKQEKAMKNAVDGRKFHSSHALESDNAVGNGYNLRGAPDKHRNRGDGGSVPEVSQYLNRHEPVRTGFHGCKTASKK